MAKSAFVSLAWLFAIAFARDALPETRVEGLALEVAPNLLILTIRGAGVSTPLLLFQERARVAVETHMNVRALSGDDLLMRGGSELQRKLAECRGDPACLRAIVGVADARYLLIISVVALDDGRLVGARFIDLSTLSVLGESLEDVPEEKDAVAGIADRIHAAVPEALWDPFGRLTIEVDEPGAQIRVDGRVVGVSPLSPIGHLIPGAHTIEVEKTGFQTASGRGVVERNGDARVSLTLVALEQDATPWLIWLGVGAAVLAGASVGAAVLLSSKSSDSVFCSAIDRDQCR